MNVEDILWTKADKTKIRLGDMSHEHLNRTLLMIQRNITRHEDEIEACYGYNGGEMAEMYALHAADAVEEKLHRAQSWEAAFITEIARRAGLSSISDAIAVLQEAREHA